MFGTLKPEGLCKGAAAAHRRAYCGLCQGLGDSFGLPWRAAHSHDAVFVALVADGLLPEGAGSDRTRCPMMPVLLRPTLAPSSPALRFAVAVQALLADQWAADRQADGRRVMAVARAALTGPVQRSWSMLADLGVDLDGLVGFEDRQHALECAGPSGPLAAAAPTADALGMGFAAMPDLPGGASLQDLRPTLRAFGEVLGRVIYLVDALDDLADDFLGDAFNPCVDRRGPVPRVVPERVDATCEQVEADLVVLQDLVADLPWRRHRSVLAGIVAGRLPREAGLAMERARQHASPDGLAELSRKREQSWVAGAVEWAAFLLIGLWTLFTPSARAAPSAEAALPVQNSMGCGAMSQFCSVKTHEGDYQVDDCGRDYIMGFPARVEEGWRGFGREWTEHMAELGVMWNHPHSLGDRLVSTCWTEPGHICWQGCTVECGSPCWGGGMAQDYVCGECINSSACCECPGFMSDTLTCCDCGVGQHGC